MSKETQNTNHIIAFDVGKRTLDVKSSTTNTVMSITNTRGAIMRRLKAEQRCGKRLELGDPLLICEATGGYEQLLLDCATELGIACYRAEGRRVRLFAMAHGLRAKTDPLDAAVLMTFAQQMECKPLYTPPSSEQKALVTLVRRRDELVQIKLAEDNRLEHATGDVRASIKALLTVLKRQIKTLEDKIQHTLKASPVLGRRNTLLQSVIGVGEKTAMTLLAHMPKLGTMSKGQVAALAGLAPYNRDSGTSNQPRHITAGRFAVRRCLFMAATVAISKNPIMTQKFKELREKGKPYKVALTAIMRKLIIILNTIIKEDQP